MHYSLDCFIEKHVAKLTFDLFTDNISIFFYSYYIIKNSICY